MYLLKLIVLPPKPYMFEFGKIRLGFSHIEVPLEYEGTRFNIKAIL